jgi:hypothetical protein
MISTDYRTAIPAQLADHDRPVLAAVETADDLSAYYADGPMATGTDASAFGSARFLLEKLVEIIDGR